ncbi:MAG: hypothetical protein GY845_28170 [Planctomycetes bacterium]|nr:hypothetical protein [Planctomycetota bacterium]
MKNSGDQRGPHRAKAEKSFWNAIDGFDPSIRKKEEEERRIEAKVKAAQRRRERAWRRRQRRAKVISYLSASDAPRNPFSEEVILEIREREKRLAPTLWQLDNEESREVLRQYHTLAAATEARYRLALFAFENSQRSHMPAFVFLAETPQKIEQWWRKTQGPEEAANFRKRREDRSYFCAGLKA